MLFDFEGPFGLRSKEDFERTSLDFGLSQMKVNFWAISGSNSNQPGVGLTVKPERVLGLTGYQLKINSA